MSLRYSPPADIEMVPHVRSVGSARMSAAADLLRKARTFIDTPGKWMQDAYCDDKGRYCLIGALRKAATGSSFSPPLDYGPSYDDAFMALVGGDPSDIEPISFNDSHTHSEVLALLDRTIEYLERKGQ